MLRVTIYRGPDVAGTLSYDGAAVTADPPDSPLLLDVLGRMIDDQQTGKPITAQDSPEAFLRNLHMTYHHPYLAASMPERVG
jgi:hypothetical protein